MTAVARKVTMGLDMNGRAPAGCRRVCVDLFVPEHPSSSLLWCCVPGGGMSRAYFDVDVPRSNGSYSMARFATSRGHHVLTIDPPAVGESDIPDDGYELTPRSVADVLHHVVSDVLGMMSAGGVDGVPSGQRFEVLGVGHSAGGLLVACQQDASQFIRRCGAARVLRQRVAGRAQRRGGGVHRSARQTGRSTSRSRASALRLAPAGRKGRRGRDGIGGCAIERGHVDDRRSSLAASRTGGSHITRSGFDPTRARQDRGPYVHRGWRARHRRTSGRPAGAAPLLPRPDPVHPGGRGPQPQCDGRASRTMGAPRAVGDVARPGASARTGSTLGTFDAGKSESPLDECNRSGNRRSRKCEGALNLSRRVEPWRGR